MLRVKGTKTTGTFTGAGVCGALKDEPYEVSLPILVSTSGGHFAAKVDYSGCYVWPRLRQSMDIIILLAPQPIDLFRGNSREKRGNKGESFAEIV